jgi:CRISPR/Cas system Type II protein with McrA/HNH and RuvC-like nuclease domain
MLTSQQRKLIRDRIHAHKRQDKRKGRDWSNNLTLDDFLRLWQEQNGRCFYTGLEMTIGQKGSKVEVSIDRLECSKPHTADNCVLACASLNFGRGDKPVKEFCDYLEGMNMLHPDTRAKLRARGLEA